MSRLLGFTELDIDVGNLNVQSCKVYEGNSYLEVVDFESEEASRSLIILDGVQVLGDTRKELKGNFDGNASLATDLIELDVAKTFPLTRFEKSDKEIDLSRVIQNVERLTNKGQNIGYAMNVALLAEYGLAGDRGNEFAHSRTFEEMQTFLEKTFPEGPPFSGGEKMDPGMMSIKFGTVVEKTSDGVEIGGVLIPKGIDTDHSLTILDNATVRKAHPKPVGAEAHV